MRRGVMQCIIKNPSIIKEGESISKGLAMAGRTMDKSITKNCSGSFRNSSQVMYGIHFKIKGNCIKRKIYARGHNQDDDLRAPEEECAESDKDDWQIIMPDEDEIDDIEEASVDDDSPCPQNRPKFSC